MRTTLRSVSNLISDRWLTRRDPLFLSTLSASRSWVSGPQNLARYQSSNRRAASPTSIFQATDEPIIVFGLFTHLHLGGPKFGSWRLVRWDAYIGGKHTVRGGEFLLYRYCSFGYFCLLLCLWCLHIPSG
jgi:hypothetical protein